MKAVPNTCFGLGSQSRFTARLSRFLWVKTIVGHDKNMSISKSLQELSFHSNILFIESLTNWHVCLTKLHIHKSMHVLLLHSIDCYVCFRFRKEVE